MLADVAIDQGGCAETSRADDALATRSTSSTASPTTASRTCPAPSRSPRRRRSRTRRCPYVEAIADHGLPRRSRATRRSRAASTSLDGRITYAAVAEAHDLEFMPLEDVLPLAPV